MTQRYTAKITKTIMSKISVARKCRIDKSAT